MDLTASLRALRRQWILAGFLLVLTFAAGAAAWVKIPGPYTTESMVVLVPSKQEAKINGNNVYLSYGGSENVAGDIVQRQVMDPATVTALYNKGYTGSYTIADDTNTTGPILDITVTGKSKSVVESTLSAVTTEVQSKLVALQQNIPAANQITSMVASFDTRATLEVSKKARVVVLAVGLGLVLTYALPQILDAEIRRRRGERASGSGSGTGYAPAPARDDEQPPPYQQPQQQPHRRRYRPAVDEPEPVVPGGGRPAARPYADRSRGAERAAPLPSDGDVSDGVTDRRSSREAARRREFTY
jgi:hypothetical protein